VGAAPTATHTASHTATHTATHAAAETATKTATDHLHVSTNMVAGRMHVPDGHIRQVLVLEAGVHPLATVMLVHTRVPVVLLA